MALVCLAKSTQIRFLWEVSYRFNQKRRTHLNLWSFVIWGWYNNPRSIQLQASWKLAVRNCPQQLSCHAQNHGASQAWASCRQRLTCSDRGTNERYVKYRDSKLSVLSRNDTWSFNWSTGHSLGTQRAFTPHQTNHFSLPSPADSSAPAMLEILGGCSSSTTGSLGPRPMRFGLKRRDSWVRTPTQSYPSRPWIHEGALGQGSSVHNA